MNKINVLKKSYKNFRKNKKYIEKNLYKCEDRLIKEYKKKYNLFIGMKVRIIKGKYSFNCKPIGRIASFKLDNKLNFQINVQVIYKYHERWMTRIDIPVYYSGIKAYKGDCEINARINKKIVEI